ncbi:MAG: bifunctional hydroxymethylpyrimidine kinase/phosphomethylpyrimidine kinase [Alphaproteobacteria bacterium]|nr:MAG: bifunctional hydroxymethylpyrimidine kinase/phosphomethylpyrimidine kinase [Alphaproteobacteria bacterium]
MSVPRILIIAGSDSGGGAGIQADIKTVTMLGGFAMTAITAITAQNTLGVDRVMIVPPNMVVAQIDSVARDIGVDAIKIGMIGSPEIADAVAETLVGLAVTGDRSRPLPIVFDPVMVATSGAELADQATIAAFERLMRLATVITPNSIELAVLTGSPPIETEDSLIEESVKLARRTGSAVIGKGGHIESAGDPEESLITNVLARSDGRITRWQMLRLDSFATHGTGCTLASALALGLGAGMDIEEAAEKALHYVWNAIEQAPGFGEGTGPMGHGLGIRPFELIHRKEK